jgi:hypothetical protein
VGGGHRYFLFRGHFVWKLVVDSSSCLLRFWTNRSLVREVVELSSLVAHVEVSQESRGLRPIPRVQCWEKRGRCSLKKKVQKGRMGIGRHLCVFYGAIFERMSDSNKRQYVFFHPCLDGEVWSKKVDVVNIEEPS